MECFTNRTVRVLAPTGEALNTKRDNETNRFPSHPSEIMTPKTTRRMIVLDEEEKDVRD